MADHVLLHSWRTWKWATRWAVCSCWWSPMGFWATPIHVSIIFPSLFHHVSIIFPSFFHPFVHHFPIIPSNESVNELCLRISWDGRSNIQVDLVIAMICLLSGSKNDEHLDPPSNYKTVIYPWSFETFSNGTWRVEVAPIYCYFW